MSKIRIGIVMDPIAGITPYKDSTLAMMLAAQKRDWEPVYMELSDLYIDSGEPRARMQPITAFDDNEHWYELGEAYDAPLDSLQIIMMRKDPPFDREYLYGCHLLALAERRGTLVVNRPEALCNTNEKLAISWFPEECAPTLVTRRTELVQDFLNKHEDIILKPLDGMGGASIFRVRKGDSNTNVILETMSQNGSRSMMAQRFLSAISEGDKRILMINGEPVEYALARIPASGENRGNLAAGGSGQGRPLSARDRQIAERVGPVLRQMGVMFAGLDVIGEHLTEVNVTSPTCIRELDAQFNLDIGSRLMDAIEDQLKN